LDSTAVHPERYDLVKKLADDLGVVIKEMLENKQILEKLDLEKFVSDEVGLYTLTDIRKELVQPGRDPRKEFRLPKFSADIKEIDDLKSGQILEGNVTNVTNFGAFVDIGVHQDGLVHISELANEFVKDPRKVVKVGDIVKVKVLKVEKELKRIGLSIKEATPPPPRPKPRPKKTKPKRAPEKDNLQRKLDALKKKFSTY